MRKIGARIRQIILKEIRSGEGQEINATLSQQLVAEYESSFDKTSLHRMVLFAEVFPDARIVATLSRQLSWSHG
jgi:hypothetical protein